MPRIYASDIQLPSILKVKYRCERKFIKEKIKKPKNLVIQSFPTLFLAGDERIELPPKVLETPIIPFDQSPILNF